MKEQRHKRIIISGGGTGGHIFPALSIAAALRSSDPGTEILFVGAEGRMEMEKVPAAGYPIKGLPVSGLVRRVSFENLKVLVRLLKSLRMAKRIIREFNPDVVVGVGGYASGPVLPGGSESQPLYRNRTAMPELPTGSWQRGLQLSAWLMRVWRDSSRQSGLSLPGTL